MRTGARTRDEPPRRPAREQADLARRLAHHARLAGIGFAAGMMLIVPVVLWLTERPAAPVARQGAVVPIVGAPAEAPPVLTQGPHPASRAKAGIVVETAAAEAALRLAERLETARRLIRARDIERARGLLEAPAATGHGEAQFLLAETFDPNRLAALGVTDVRAESERARHLYERALAAGIEAARARLEQLR
jgi:hypothetical protein